MRRADVKSPSVVVNPPGVAITDNATQLPELGGAGARVSKTVVGAVIGQHFDDDLGKSPVHEDFQWEKHIREIKKLWEIG